MKHLINVAVAAVSQQQESIQHTTVIQDLRKEVIQAGGKKITVKLKTS